MPPQIRVGRVIRSGAGNIPAETMKALVENETQVKKIVEEIDDRIEVYFKEQKVVFEGASANKEQKKVLEAQATKLAEDATQQTDNLMAANKRLAADQEEVAHRVRNVTEREAAAKERDAALDAREQENKDRDIQREQELRGREGEVGAGEAALEEREEALLKQLAVVDALQNRLQTAAKMVKQAAASLG